MTDRKLIIKKEGWNSHQQQDNDNRKSYSAADAAAKMLTGDSSGLECQIYDINIANQSELFANTTKMVTGHTGRVYKETSVICQAIKKLRVPLFIKPTF